MPYYALFLQEFLSISDQELTGMFGMILKKNLAISLHFLKIRLILSRNDYYIFQRFLHRIMPYSYKSSWSRTDRNVWYDSYEESCHFPAFSYRYNLSRNDLCLCKTLVKNHTISSIFFIILPVWGIWNWRNIQYDLFIRSYKILCIRLLFTRSTPSFIKYTTPGVWR